MSKISGYFSLIVDAIYDKTKNILAKHRKEEIIVQIYEEKPEVYEVAHTVKEDDPLDRLMTISEAARRNRVSRQAIYFAIKMKRLEAVQEGGAWLVSTEQLKKYIKTKYCRSKSRVEGELIFDKNKGYYSISEVAKILRRSLNQVYYLVRLGKIKTHRQGGNIVIKESDLESFIESTKKKSRKSIAV